MARISAGLHTAAVRGSRVTARIAASLLRSIAAVAALTRAINPQADATRTTARAGELVAYEIAVDPNATPRLEAPETALARFSGAATFEFR